MYNRVRYQGSPLLLRDRLVQVQDACSRPSSMRPAPPARASCHRATRRWSAARPLPSVPFGNAPACSFARRVSTDISDLVAGRAVASSKAMAARLPGVLPACFEYTLGQGSRGFDIGRIVQHHQRLQRRVRTCAVSCTSRDPAHRTWSSEPAATSASRTCTCCGGTDPSRGSGRRSALRSRRQTPSLPTTLPADTGTRSCRRIVVQQAADGERVVADHLRGQPVAGTSRQQPVLRIFLMQRRSHLRGPAVGRGRHDQTLHRLHVPPGANELGREPVEQFGMRGGSPCEPKFSAVFTRPVPKYICQ